VFACEAVRLVDAGDADDELADLPAVGAAVGTREAGDAGLGRRHRWIPLSRRERRTTHAKEGVEG
jgi:hypothetical protein